MSWFAVLRRGSLLHADRFHSLVNSAMDLLTHTREVHGLRTHTNGRNA